MEHSNHKNEHALCVAYVPAQIRSRGLVLMITLSVQMIFARLEVVKWKIKVKEETNV